MRPDLAGFADAQQRLRDAFGENVVFLEEPSVTFPPDTAINPETGQPYDPVIEPTASAQASAAVKCDVVFRAINRAGVGGESEDTAAGIFERTRVMLIAPSGAASAIEPAVSFRCRGDEYQVHATKFDGVGEIQRLLVYGAKRGPE